MSKDSVIIIDHGSGNLRSAAKAFETVIRDENMSLDVQVSARPEDVLKASRIVLPGQGAFGDCMAGLTAIEGMREALEERVIKDGVPFLGICVGMQLMATRGLEHGVHGGLDWIAGEVVPFDLKNQSLKIPHMGWNGVVSPGPAAQDNRHMVLRSIENSDLDPTHFYFVHSFVFQCNNIQHALGITDYGGYFASVVGRDNMVGVQFHPEKSQDAGLRLISDYLHWMP